MQQNSLQTFIKNVTKDWTGLNSEHMLFLREQMQQLAQATTDEAWLAAIHNEQPEAVELYSDETHGFKLIAHAREAGIYRPPHDHGNGWVLYAVNDGETRIGTYKEIMQANGEKELVTRGKDVLRKGDCMVFLPGDIHDTHCLSEKLVQFRLTSSDFAIERSEGRLRVFPTPNS